LAPDISAADMVKIFHRNSQSAVSRSSGLAGPASAAASLKGGSSRSGLVFSGPQIAAVCDLIEKFADVDIPVLITGETGTGKELIAQALHKTSARAEHPFMAINCAAISDMLIESELFGHKKGAFTGAEVTYKGLFREAGKGTVFLDEIGDISPRLQVALLRVLETNEVRPVGSSETHKTECRVVAATNADLHLRAAKGSFRKDLIYRLQALQIQVPPLRERPEDVITLAEYFLNVGRAPGEVAALSEGLKQFLYRQPWWGNVRELKNVVERMRVLNSDKTYYDLEDLKLKDTVGSAVSSAEVKDAAATNLIAPLENTPEDLSSNDAIDKLLRSQRTTMRRLERLRELFKRHKRLKSGEVAKILGVSRPTASRYLSELKREGVVEKITPTRSRSSHYYQIK
jgi:DNA-binding NtrC family response regulator